MSGNNLDFDALGRLRKLFGGVNPQSGVVWGNKFIISLVRHHLAGSFIR